MSPVLRQVLAFLFIAVLVVVAGYLLLHSRNPSAGIGAAIGIVVVMLIGNRRRRRA